MLFKKPNTFLDAPFYMRGKKEVILIHPLKTGGTTLRWSLKFNKVNGNAHGFGKHYPAFAIEEIIGRRLWKRAFRFAFVRNPWDRMLSLYRYRVRKGLLGEGDSLMPFDQWIVESFDQLSKTKKPYHHLDPQVKWLRSGNGKIEMDFIGRHERFEEDFLDLCQKLKVEPRLKTKNVNPEKVDYKAFYTPQTKEIVAQFHQEDLDEFGYSF